MKSYTYSTIAIETHLVQMVTVRCCDWKWLQWDHLAGENQGFLLWYALIFQKLKNGYTGIVNHMQNSTEATLSFFSTDENIDPFCIKSEEIYSELLKIIIERSCTQKMFKQILSINLS